MQNDGTSVYVANLSKRVTDRDLEEAFEKHGKIRKTQVVIDPISRYVTKLNIATNQTYSLSLTTQIFTHVIESPDVLVSSSLTQKKRRKKQ